MMMKKIDRYQLIVFFIMPFLLSWPAWFNGQPFLFADTTAYIKGAASAVDLVVKTDLARTWLTPRASAKTAAGNTVAPTPAADSDHSSTPDKGGVIAGRSVYYGLFIFLTACLLGLKGVPVLQALISIGLIVSLLRTRFSASYKTIALALLLLAVASPLPFFNSLLMPDVFAGLGLACAVALILLPQASAPMRAFWALLLLAAVLFHTGNIMIILATVITLVLLSLLLRRRAPAPMVLAALVMVALGVGGESLFNFAVKHITHSAPIRPPFMTARLLADGPGTRYVQDYCADSALEVCKYRRDFTHATSDDFLWSQNPAIGVFTLAPKSSRQLLGQQDFAFAKAVFMRYPMQVIGNSARNIGQQLGFIGLEEFVYTPDIVHVLSLKIPPGVQAALESSRAATGRFDVRYAELLIKTATVLALLVCVAFAAGAGARRQWDDFRFVAIFLLSVLINAGVCGALSTPHDRYQARIMWIPELLALIVVAGRYRPAKQA